jgi:hypothetical protein
MSKNLFGISDKLINDVKSVLGEKLTGGQVNLDVDKDGKIEASDFKKLRNKKLAAKMKKHETGETAGQEKKEHSGPCSADCDCMKEDVDLGEDKTEYDKNKKETQKTFPNVKYFTKKGHPDWAKHDSMKEEDNKDTPPFSKPYKNVPADHKPSKSHRQKLARSGIPMKEEIDISEKVEVTIKKKSSYEPNVSKRHISYDVYHDGKYHKSFNDINDAMDHKEKMQKEDYSIDEARGRPKKVKPGEEAADNEGDDTGSIVMKLRKASSIGKPVQFKDNSTHEISKSDARKALAKHDALRTSIEKEKLADRMHASHASFKDVLAGKGEPEEMTLMQKIQAARAARRH